MNEQFTKTLDALEAAENEMMKLHNTIDSLERVNRATYSENQTAARFLQELRGMMSSVTAMLEKREKALLEGVRAQNMLHSDDGESPASDDQSSPAPSLVS